MEIHKYKNTLATVKKMHACKSGAMEKTGSIPRFEIIGRFNLTNVPHAISLWTSYITMVKCSFRNKKKISMPDRKLGFTRPIFFFFFFFFLFLLFFFFFQIL